MKKSLTFVVFLLIISTLFITSVCASQELMFRLDDEADVLTENEEGTLNSRLNEFNNKYKNEDNNFALIIGTINIEKAIEVENYADGIAKSNKDSDLVILVVSFDRNKEREWHIFTYGDGKEAITSSEKESMFDEMQNVIGNDNYVAAFNAFIDECDYYINGYINGFPFEAGKNVIISIVIGFIIAFIVVSVMKGKLKSVAFQRDATTYVKQGSMNVTVSRDFFLYRTVTRTAKPQNNSSERTTAGGGNHSSRKF